MSPSYTPDKLRLAGKIKAARQAAGKSQERIAAEVGTTRRHWIRWENGEHRPTPAFVARIAEACGVDESSFADDEEDSLHPAALDLALALSPLFRLQERERVA